MEKLIELLNEWYLERYGTDPHFVRFKDYGGNDYGYFVGDDKLMVETEVWTKKYGFIEWLVQKDKIDTFKILEKRFDTQKGCEREHYHTVNEGNTDLLLMLLAISDNPIEDLIGYLK